MLTIAPFPARSIAGVTSRASRTTLTSTRSRPRCQSASGMARMSPLGGWPVLFTTASIRPQRSSVASTRRCRSAGSVTEPRTAMPPSSCCQRGHRVGGGEQRQPVAAPGQLARDRGAHPPAGGGDDRHPFGRAHRCLLPLGPCLTVAPAGQETNGKFFTQPAGKLHARRPAAAAERPARLPRRGPAPQLPGGGRGAERDPERRGPAGARAGAGAGRPAVRAPRPAAWP